MNDIQVLIPVLYFLPFIVARLRGYIGCTHMFFANLLFGWTVIGWIIALHGALTGLTEDDLDRLYGPVDDKRD